MTTVSQIQPRKRSSAASFRAIALWLLVQIAALMLPVYQVALSDKFPRPVESMALDEMLVAQIGAAAMLFPIVCSTFASTIIAIACTWPFIQLAGTFSAAEPVRLLLVGTYVAAWLMLLGMWRAMLSSERTRLIAAGAACLVSIGLAAMWYLRVEFKTERLEIDWAKQGMLGPIMGALAVLHERHTSIEPWISMFAAMGITIAAGVLILVRARHRRLGNSPTEATPMA